MTEHAWSRQEFEQKLREKGAYYHIHHPFHKRMNEGHCSVDEIQGWVANRLYYQMAIPVKDARNFSELRRSIGTQNLDSNELSITMDGKVKTDWAA